MQRDPLKYAARSFLLDFLLYFTFELEVGSECSRRPYTIKPNLSNFPQNQAKICHRTHIGPNERLSRSLDQSPRPHKIQTQKNVISSSSCCFRGCSFSCAERGSFWGSNDRSNLARYSRLHCTRSRRLTISGARPGTRWPRRGQTTSKNCQPRRNLFSWLPREDGSLGHGPGKNVLLRKF